ncbi:FRG domain-containing protein [Microterricola pindariensis]|uniref:FRG domain-containing protein n=1 Tax=Microterricola pindariensis TaxID=478010 RepID=UPI0010572AAE|nr:FRG domain-containing protein [Microterricola pindariensis]
MLESYRNTSTGWVSPASVWEPWDIPVHSWEQFLEQTRALTETHGYRDMLWRGSGNADWALFSSLYRTLLDASPTRTPPTEDQMVAAEVETLRLAREDWRFDDMPALELLARLQHFGAPTRLVDVSENPLVALWFAVERTLNTADADARVFAFAKPATRITLNSAWGGRDLRWHELTNDARRLVRRWGTGSLKYWRPPAYDSRISSQNAGFIVDGAPFAFEGDRQLRSARGRSMPWSTEDLRHTSSLPLRLSHIERDPISQYSAPVFTFRIARDAKAEIRQKLEANFGYRASTLYSDMVGLSDYLTRHIGSGATLE